MGLFALDFRGVEGGVYAEGELKFRADETALRRYFAAILPRVSLNDLIGEAVFWVHFGETVSIWTLPVVIYIRGLGTGLAVATLAYLAAEIASRAVYVKTLNYMVFVLGNRLLQIGAYCAFAAFLWFNDQRASVLVIGVWLASFHFGVTQLVLGMLLLPLHGRLFSLPPSDQGLRNVGFHYGVRFGFDPMKWRMYGPDDRGGG